MRAYDEMAVSVRSDSARYAPYHYQPSTMARESSRLAQGPGQVRDLERGSEDPAEGRGSGGTPKGALPLGRGLEAEGVGQGGPPCPRHLRRSRGARRAGLRALGHRRAQHRQRADAPGRPGLGSPTMSAPRPRSAASPAVCVSLAGSGGLARNLGCLRGCNDQPGRVHNDRSARGSHRRRVPAAR